MSASDFNLTVKSRRFQNRSIFTFLLQKEFGELVLRDGSSSKLKITKFKLVVVACCYIVMSVLFINLRNFDKVRAELLLCFSSEFYLHLFSRH